MNQLFTEQEVPLADHDRQFTLRTPIQICEQPALLINLSKDRHSSLDEHPYAICPRMFLAAGHYVASFDLPNHGENENRFGSQLKGMAAAMAAGEDVFGTVRRQARSLIDVVYDKGLVRHGRVGIAGTSRGGLSALHAMAGSPDIAAGALMAPVTQLPLVSEFAALEGLPVVERSNAHALIPQVAGRPIFVTIGLTDHRVSTAHCLDFSAKLAAANNNRHSILRIDAADGHRSSDAAHQQAALFLLQSLS